MRIFLLYSYYFGNIKGQASDKNTKKERADKTFGGTKTLPALININFFLSASGFLSHIFSAAIVLTHCDYTQ